MATWTRDELILTLDLYLESGHRILEPKRPEIEDLVRIINQLRAQDETIPANDARTAASIKAKMVYFRALDPDHESSGWGNGGRRDLEVWSEFANDPAARAQEVARIRRQAART